MSNRAQLARHHCQLEAEDVHTRDRQGDQAPECHIALVAQLVVVGDCGRLGRRPGRPQLSLRQRAESRQRRTLAHHREAHGASVTGRVRANLGRHRDRTLLPRLQSDTLEWTRGELHAFTQVNTVPK